MELRVAKELLHIQRWLDVVESIVDGGKAAYDRDPVAQEAGDSLMIKIGEASKYLAASGIGAPQGVNWSHAAKNREVLAHHYSTVDRNLTWQTLSVSLREWQTALAPLFAEAKEVIDADSPPERSPA
jgi:uncharacterized protein with HEPN domain